MSTTEKTDDNPDMAVKFIGMSAAVQNPPAIGDVQTFTVTARCVGDGRDERQSGGVVGYRKMRVLEVEAGEITPAPEGDPVLPFDTAADED